MVEGSLAHKLLISLPAAIEMLSERLPVKEAKTLLVKGLTEGEIELSSSKATFMLPYFSGHLSDDEKKNLIAELHAEFLEMMVEMSAPSDSNFDFGWTSKPSVGTFLLKTDYGADDLPSSDPLEKGTYRVWGYHSPPNRTRPKSEYSSSRITVLAPLPITDALETDDFSNILAQCLDDVFGRHHACLAHCRNHLLGIVIGCKHHQNSRELTSEWMLATETRVLRPIFTILRSPEWMSS